MKKMNKNVLGMWDALRGLMVVMVILAHSVGDGMTLCGVQEFPVLFRVIAKSRGIVLVTFFMISGYLFRPKKKGLGKQYSEYLRVYLLTIAAMLAARMLHNLAAGEAVFSRVAMLLGGAIYGATSVTVIRGFQLEFPFAMWFFAVYMHAWLLLEGLLRIKKQAIRYLLLIGLPALFFVYAALTAETYPLALLPLYPVQTVIACLLMAIGYFVKTSNVLFKKVPVYVLGGCAVLAVYTFVFGQVQLLENYYELGVLDYLGCISGTLLIMYIYVRIMNPESRIIEKLMWFGRRSFIVIPIHCVEYALFDWVGMDALGALGIYGSTGVIFILRSAAIVLMCIIFERVQRTMYKHRMMKARA